MVLWPEELGVGGESGVAEGESAGGKPGRGGGADGGDGRKRK